MSRRVKFHFFEAVDRGLASEVSSLLRDHPEINVNCTTSERRPPSEQWTALHAASEFGHVEVVKLLLAHPNINANLKDGFGRTPFSLGCRSGQVSVVQVLLKDLRVDVTLEDNGGRTPLWWAAFGGFLEVIEWLITSGRDLGDFKNKRGKIVMHGNGFTALEIARKEKRSEIVSLLERFMANPALTRHDLCVRLGVLDDLAAEVFALVVFLCDDLLQLKPASHLAATPDHTAASRFFTIAKRLPMELQMIICHRAVGSMKQSILRKDSEAAFKSLARILLS